MLTFSTKNGEYLYDDGTGIIFPLPGLLKETIPLSGLPKEEAISVLIKRFPGQEEEVRHSYELANKWKRIGAFQSYNPLDSMREPTVEELREYTLREGLKELTLNVTENCNLRCKYCIYSGEYEYSRVHSPNRMDPQTAKKAIDLYLNLIDEGRRYNPNRRPSIGFYGGEPLTEFPLIKRCVEYVKERYDDFDVQYAITTNGTLLDERKIDFLLQNDLSFILSLDGPKPEHDRKRVYPSGEGSFDDIMANVEILKRKFVELGLDQQAVNTITIMDWKTDLLEVEKFFDDNPFFIPSMVSFVNPYFGCHYYERFKREDYERFHRQYEEEQNRYVERAAKGLGVNKRVSFLDALFGEPINRTLFLRMVLYKPYTFLPCTGACVPGRKFFVEYDGTLQICERVNGSHPIGNLEDGMDFEKVRRVIIDYQEALENCRNCPTKKMCGECYTGFEKDKGFHWPGDRCSEMVDDLERTLSQGYSIAELNPSFFDQYTQNYYKAVEKIFEELI